LPNKKQTKITVPVTDENLPHAVIIVGDNTKARPTNSTRDDAEKPLYLRRM
jgi:hypothetical protein